MCYGCVSLLLSLVLNNSNLAWPNQPFPTQKMFETFYHYARKSFCSNVKHHIRKERLTLDQRLGPWHRQRRHSRNEWYRTHEWMYNVAPAPDGDETVTRLQQSTALVDHFVPDVTVDDAPSHAHPVTASTSDHGTRPHQDYILLWDTSCTSSPCKDGAD